MMLENLAESLNIALLPRQYQESTNDERQQLESQIDQKEKSKNVTFKAIEAILVEEIDLAKPVWETGETFDGAYLESQVPRIAGRIVDFLGLRDDP